MPKAKKLRAPALESQQVRHEPLGQVIEGDANRSKYALPIRGKRRTAAKVGGGGGGAGLVGVAGLDSDNQSYLDEKTSRKILDMTAEQQVEEDLKQQRQQLRERRPQAESSRFDSDDDDADEEENVEILVDEGDE